MTTAKEYEAQIRDDIAQEREYVSYVVREHEARVKCLNEREAQVKEMALAMVAADKAAAQHDVNVSVAERVKRIRSGDTYRDAPTTAEIQAAHDYFGTTSEIFAMTYAVMERPDAEIELVLLHRQNVRSSEASAERQAREAAIQRLVSEERDAEYVARVKQQQRLEA
jgi:hypothetical protein